MTTVRITVTSPVGDVEVKQEDPVHQFGTVTDFNRGRIEKLLAKAVAQIQATYGIESK